MWYDFETKDGKHHEYKLGDLDEGTYLYYVRCKDEDQTANNNSKALMFSVNSNYDSRIETDIASPQIANVGVSQASVKRGDTAAITAQISDNVKATKVIAQLRSADGKYKAVVSLNDDGASGDGNANDGIWGYRWDSTGKVLGDYQVTVIATDAAGNFGQADNAARFALIANAGSLGDIGGNGYCKPLQNNGPSDKKLDVVFVACGYGNDMASFEADAQKQAQQFAKYSPLTQNIAKFNFTAAQASNLDCESKWSGNMDKDTIRFKQAALPCDPDVVMVIKKSSESASGISYGGAGIGFVSAFSATASVHETGHAYFNLNDEYSYGCTAADMSASPNCDNDPGCSKWKGVEGAGCFAGCTCEGNYRSSNDSVMLDAAVATQFSPAASRQILAALAAFE